MVFTPEKQKQHKTCAIFLHIVFACVLYTVCLMVFTPEKQKQHKTCAVFLYIVWISGAMSQSFSQSGGKLTLVHHELLCIYIIPLDLYTYIYTSVASSFSLLAFMLWSELCFLGWGGDGCGLHVWSKFWWRNGKLYSGLWMLISCGMKNLFVYLSARPQAWCRTNNLLISVVRKLYSP